MFKTLLITLITFGIVGCGSGGISSFDPEENQKDLRELLTSYRIFGFGGAPYEYIIYQYDTNNTYIQSFMRIDDNSLIEEDTYAYSIIGDILTYDDPITEKEITCELVEATDTYIELKCKEGELKFSETYWYSLDNLKENYDL
jgi:hypothetical protein